MFSKEQIKKPDKFLQGAFSEQKQGDIQNSIKFTTAEDALAAVKRDGKVFEFVRKNCETNWK